MATSSVGGHETEWLGSVYSVVPRAYHVEEARDQMKRVRRRLPQHISLFWSERPRPPILILDAPNRQDVICRFCTGGSLCCP